MFRTRLDPDQHQSEKSRSVFIVVYPDTHLPISGSALSLQYPYLHQAPLIQIRIWCVTSGSALSLPYPDPPQSAKSGFAFKAYKKAAARPLKFVWAH
jgi:hypothetical protein